MSENILAELYGAKVEKERRAEEAAARREKEHQQMLWEAGELRRTVIKPRNEIAERLDGLLKTIGVDSTDISVPTHSYNVQSLEEAFEDAREGQYRREQLANVESASLLVDLGELPADDRGVEHAVAQLFAKHTQKYVGSPKKISRMKSKREYQVVEKDAPTLRKVGLKISTFGGDQEGDLLDDSLWYNPAAAYYQDEVLANESELQSLRGQKQSVITMGSVLALLEARIDGHPERILPPSDEFAHMPGSWHLSEC